VESRKSNKIMKVERGLVGKMKGIRGMGWISEGSRRCEYDQSMCMNEIYYFFTINIH
jgi:hypothetical protein